MPAVLLDDEDNPSYFCIPEGDTFTRGSSNTVNTEAPSKSNSDILKVGEHFFQTPKKSLKVKKKKKNSLIVD